MDDKNLIEQIKQKDRHAFQLLVERYQTMVINVCNGFVQNYQDAEDVAQEVFIDIYTTAHKFRGDSKLSTWIYRIAVNKSLNYIRDNKKRNSNKSISDGISDINNSITDIKEDEYKGSEYLLENEERKKNIHTAISALPENQKTAFILSKFEDLSYKEISNVMKLSVSSVESLLFRAKKNLQKKLFECYKKLGN